MKHIDQFLTKGTVAAALLMVMPLNAEAAQPPSKPWWVSPTEIQSDTGNGKLQWDTATGEAVDLIEVEEKFGGTTSVIYTDGKSLNLFRGQPGKYEFRISACVREESTLLCSPRSNKLTFEVTEDIYTPLLESAGDKKAAPPPVAIQASAATGGPSVLQPGFYGNANRQGHGWSFYWANDLALSPFSTSGYDLYAVWYTHEAKTPILPGTPICEPPDPPCGLEYEVENYRPIALTLKLVDPDGDGHFQGGVSVTRDGTTSFIGSASITFGANKVSATINLSNLNFRWETIFNLQETITLLVGDPAPSNVPSDLSGLWEPANGGQSYFIIHDLGYTSESVEVVFL